MLVPQKQNGESGSQLNATLEVQMCYSFKSSPMQKYLQPLKGKTSKTRAGFSGDISNPFS